MRKQPAAPAGPSGSASANTPAVNAETGAIGASAADVFADTTAALGIVAADLGGGLVAPGLLSAIVTTTTMSAVDRARFIAWVKAQREAIAANPFGYDAASFDQDAAYWDQFPAMQQYAAAYRQFAQDVRVGQQGGYGMHFPNWQVPAPTGVQGPPVAIPSSFSSQVQPTPVAQPNVLVIPGAVPPAPAPPPSPVFAPQRGGPASAAAAARSALTEGSAIHGVGAFWPRRA
jgi:hypothetical protein